jgi:hypothetical protein
VVWTIFSLNVLTIVVAFKKRMILYALLNAIFLFLITGQAFQLQAELERSHTVTYLLNFVSDIGFSLALRYVLGISIFALVLAIVSRGYRRQLVSESAYSFAPRSVFYILLFLYLSLVSFVLIFMVVGLNEFLHSSRPGFQSGATIFIVLLFLGIVPLLLKIITKSKVTRGDFVCFFLAFAVSGAFSRIHLILYLTALLLSYFYAYGWADRPITPRLVARMLVFGLVAGIAFFGIGALRDAQNFVQGSIGDLMSYILANPEKSILSVEYNYRVGVEGMSGIAGAFSQSLSNPISVHRDFGLSSALGGVLLSMPGFAKAYATSVGDLSNSLNWYPYSIIPTGAESFFMSFGWAAVFLYPLAVYFLGWVLPLRVISMKASPKMGLSACIFLACSIFFVRGSLASWIAFNLAYAVVTFSFWPFLRHACGVRQNREEKA